MAKKILLALLILAILLIGSFVLNKILQESRKVLYVEDDISGNASLKTINIENREIETLSTFSNVPIFHKLLMRSLLVYNGEALENGGMILNDFEKEKDDLFTLLGSEAVAKDAGLGAGTAWSINKDFSVFAIKLNGTGKGLRLIFRDTKEIKDIDIFGRLPQDTEDSYVLDWYVEKTIVEPFIYLTVYRKMPNSGETQYFRYNYELDLLERIVEQDLPRFYLKTISENESTKVYLTDDIIQESYYKPDPTGVTNINGNIQIPLYTTYYLDPSSQVRYDLFIDEQFQTQIHREFIKAINP